MIYLCGTLLSFALLIPYLRLTHRPGNELKALKWLYASALVFIGTWILFAVLAGGAS